MISVIMPCYNCQSFVSRAIESVLKQTYTDWELILVNNNSADQTQSVLDGYCALYPDKIYTYIEMKPGAPAARNKGLKYAKGEWIQFMDSDDELYSDKIEKQVEIAENTSCDIVSGAYYLNKLVDGKVINTLKVPRNANIYESLISSKLGITSANLWRKEAVLAVGGWDESLTSSQEYDMLFRMIVAHAVIGFDMHPRTIVYSLENSVSNSLNKQRLIRILENRVSLRLRIKQHLSNEGLLTIQLAQFWDLYLYDHLIKRKLLVPEYVFRRLNELAIRVPLKVVIKQKARFFLQRIFGK
ncbi:glycosyltransferase family 2 protein [Arcticibacter eurypsychrophilus]|uniref:glycosyltransferase family 2 protein n=1 Tax=Arcticibacter eurypsychrophilus TaxID=1434752 RepID=UPI001FE1CA5E|nr:glycosyltransferase [Arcticibacter eurypsychrophilus]